MSKIIIGCDPDSKASGMAFYVNGKLIRLQGMSLIEIFNFFNEDKFNCKTELHIEDLNANRCSSFNHKKSMRDGVKAKISEKVGKCKQVQIEVERIAEHFDIKIVRHKVSKMWKEDKKQFELVTKWNGRSNEDTRSAAYFGFLGLKG
jgi:hypothetical protein